MNPADLSLTISPTLEKASAPSLLKVGGFSAGKSLYPRVDLEPIYTQLRSALGERWEEYKACVEQFVLGNLNQAELSWVLRPLLNTTPIPPPAHDLLRPVVSSLYLHNALIASIYANTLRDPPPSEVASWVVATDQPSSTSKNASGAGTGANDQAEERLKQEVMNLQPRDRKRVKSLKDNPTSTLNNKTRPGLAELRAFHHELAVKPPSSTTTTTTTTTTNASSTANATTSDPNNPSTIPTDSPTTTTAPSAPGLAKTNLSLEIRRKYAQPLSIETLEFPSLEAMQARIEPICYEEGLSGGVASGALAACAELVEQAAEVYVKEMLAGLLKQARSNGAGFGGGGVGIVGGAVGGGGGGHAGGVAVGVAGLVGSGGVVTHGFRKRVRWEASEVEEGRLQRNALGLLPVEVEGLEGAEPVDLVDLRLAVGLGNGFVRGERFLRESVMLKEWGREIVTGKVNGLGNGHVGGGVEEEDVMDVDEDFGGFVGTSRADRQGLMGALDDCLLAAG